MKQTIYLVTGAAGHLGGTVVRSLAARGDRVRALVLPGERMLPPGAEIFAGDVRDSQSLEAAFRHGPDEELRVIHCAGIVSIASRRDPLLRAVNVGGTRNVVDLCLKHGAAKLVHVSSVHAIPEKPPGETITETGCFDPETVEGFYAKTKAEATAFVLAAAGRGLDVTVVHPSGITGPFDYGRGHLTTLIIDYCKRRLTAGIDGGYDFVDVRDVADGILAACDTGRPANCYILSNRFFTVREILEMLHEITGQKPVRTFLPLWFVKATAPFAELYYKILRQPPLYTAYSIYTLNSNALFSHEKADRELGYKTRDMRETLEDTVIWLQSQGRI